MKNKVIKNVLISLLLLVFAGAVLICFYACVANLLFDLVDYSWWHFWSLGIFAAGGIAAVFSLDLLEYCFLYKLRKRRDELLENLKQQKPVSD